ncbi:MAG: MFS transporter [Proteobacteria bacterium]|nr:MFS transporter [Pseudomonadota bacterium]
MTGSPAPATANAATVSRTAAGWSLAVLSAINLLNYLDRYVVAPLAPDLQSSMHLSDTQLGTLVPAFMLVYTCTAPLFGAWGDRGVRTRPIAAGVLIWSLATLLSGFAADYRQLLAARAFVGIGEAAFVAVAPALLADCFPVGKRGRVYAALNTAIPVGSALGYILGGYVGHHFGWRAAFFMAGAPGLVLAGAVLLLRDPRRGAQDALPGAAPARPSTPLAVYAALLRRRHFMLIVLGYAAYTFALGGLAFWMPTFLQRVRGVPAQEAATGFGTIVVVTGFIGTFAGGWLGDWLLQRTRQAYLWLSGGATLLAVPCAMVALTAAAPMAYYPAIVAAELLLFLSTGPINAAIINAVAPWERASAVALSMFGIHLLGDVPSPFLIGYASDLSSLGRAVLMVPLAVLVGAAIWLAAAWAGAADGQPAISQRH